MQEMKDPYRTELIFALSEKFRSGVYKDPAQISEILNICLAFYNSKLIEVNRRFNSKELILDLLFRLENLQNLKRSQEVIGTEEAILYLAEICLENFQSTGQEINNAEFIEIKDLCLECLKYAHISNTAYYIFQDSVLQLNLDKPDDLWSIDTIEKQNEMVRWFTGKAEKSGDYRKLEGGRYDLLTYCLSVFYSTLDGPFEKEFGIKISEMSLSFSRWFIQPRKISRAGEMPALGFSQIEYFCRMNKLDSNKVMQVYDGLSLSPEISNSIPRYLLNYKQQVRLRNRPMVKLPFINEYAFCFSPQFLMKRLAIMLEDIPLRYQDRLPEEWKTGPIRQALAGISTSLGEVWFEERCLDLLAGLGFQGFKPTIGSFPKEVGPPDIIAIYPELQALFIFECKLVDQEFEAKGIRNQLDSFIKSGKGYFAKLERKVEWAAANLETIKSLIDRELKSSSLPKIEKIYFSFLTYYPTHVEYFDNRIPTPTLFEFRLDFISKLEWPYEMGIKDII